MIPNSYNRTQRRSHPLFRWAALLCIWAIGTVSWLAVSPELHEALHCDADHQEHECIITLFAHGVEPFTGTHCVTFAPQIFVSSQCAAQPDLPVATAPHRLPPGRGPPSC